MWEWLKEILSQFFDYLKPWALINYYEEGIILRWGRYRKTLTPGIYFKWPFADYLYTLHIKPDTIDIPPVSITTLDGKTLSIGMMIEYEITNSKSFLIDNNDSLSNMKDISRGEMSDFLEDINWEDIRKKTTKNALKRKISTHLETLGIKVIDINFTDKCQSRVLTLHNNKEKNINAI